MEQPYSGIFRSWYLWEIFNDIGKCLIYNIEWKNKNNQNYIFNAISIGKEKCIVSTQTHNSYWKKKIKMLTVVSSDFYFMVTRIFQTFTNMHGLLLISEFSNVTIKQKPSPNDSQVVRTIFLLRVSRAEMRSQAGGPHKGNAEAGILVLSRKLNTNNNNTHFVCIMTRLANYGPKAKSCHSELLAC